MSSRKITSFFRPVATAVAATGPGPCTGMGPGPVPWSGQRVQVQVEGDKENGAALRTAPPLRSNGLALAAPAPLGKGAGDKEQGSAVATPVLRKRAASPAPVSDDHPATASGAAEENLSATPSPAPTLPPPPKRARISWEEALDQLTTPASNTTPCLVAPEWRDALLRAEAAKPYFGALRQRLLALAHKPNAPPIYPAPRDLFAAFALPPTAARVIILGQDPYHRPGQAHGLSFSVPRGTPKPPSLVNIFRELATDIPGFRIPGHGCLQGWAEQGVILLNATLTVTEGHPNSHAKLGWATFTDAVIAHLAESSPHLVFMLWWGEPPVAVAYALVALHPMLIPRNVALPRAPVGNRGGFAQKKGQFISAKEHLVLRATHPSPLGANKGGWFGCRHFSQANAYLEFRGLAPIDWARL